MSMFLKNRNFPNERNIAEKILLKHSELKAVLNLTLVNCNAKLSSMITLINFKHNSQPVTAKVIFLCEAYKKEVVVEVLACKRELGERILITELNGRWTTDSAISRTFFPTYLAILHEINWIVSQKYYEARPIHVADHAVNLN